VHHVLAISGLDSALSIVTLFASFFKDMGFEDVMALARSQFAVVSELEVMVLDSAHSVWSAGWACGIFALDGVRLSVGMDYGLDKLPDNRLLLWAQLFPTTLYCCFEQSICFLLS
jgi:hypothetical protein